MEYARDDPSNVVSFRRNEASLLKSLEETVNNSGPTRRDARFRPKAARFKIQARSSRFKHHLTVTHARRGPRDVKRTTVRFYHNHPRRK